MAEYAEVIDVPNYPIVITIQGWVERANDPRFIGLANSDMRTQATRRR